MIMDVGEILQGVMVVILASAAVGAWQWSGNISNALRDLVSEVKGLRSDMDAHDRRLAELEKHGRK